MEVNQKSIESCPQKDEIFKAISTWEKARAANAFPYSVKKQLANPSKDWSLEEVNKDTWRLYQKIGGVKVNPILLTRAKGY
jgi:hypothetical protein